MNIVAGVCGFLYARWLAIPYGWRRRIVLGAIFWAVFRILAWQWGFERLVVYLLIAVIVTYLVTEVGLRRTRPLYAWFYRQLSGQVLGVFFAALVPVIAEAWIRAARLGTWEELAVAASTTFVVIFLWWVSRKAVFAPVEESQLRRARRTRRRRR